MNIDRVLPNSREAEQSVLGAFIIDPDHAGALCSRMLKADDFYFAAHQTIFRELEFMQVNRVPMDLVSVSQHLTDKQRLEEIGGPAYLADLVTRVPTTSNIHYYAGIVKEKATLRRAIDLGNKLCSEVFYPIDSVMDWLAEKQSSLYSISSDGGTQRGAGIVSDHRLDVEQAIVDRIQKRNTGLETGFASLDKLLCGLKPQSLNIVAARPSTGKTAFALNVCANLAEQGKQTVFFSLEQSARQIIMRMIAAESRQNMYDIKSHKALMDAVEKVHAWPLWVDERGGLKASQIGAEARRLARSHQIEAVVIDRLELIGAPDQKMGLFEKTTVNSGMVKDIAKELNLPVILVCQLNRRVEQEERLAKLSDLRMSGAIEENATTVTLLNDDLKQEHVPNYLKSRLEKMSLEGLVLLDVAKNQDGPTGEIILNFHREYTRFDSLVFTKKEDSP